MDQYWCFEQYLKETKLQSAKNRKKLPKQKFAKMGTIDSIHLATPTHLQWRILKAPPANPRT